MASLDQDFLCYLTHDTIRYDHTDTEQFSLSLWSASSNFLQKGWAQPCLRKSEQHVMLDDILTACTRGPIEREAAIISQGL